MAYNVKFLRGTAEGYKNLATKEATTFYLAGTDLYLGDIKLSNGADLTAAIARIATNESDIDNLEVAVGTIGSLKTTAKTDLVSALNELFDAVGANKTEAAQAVKALADGAVKKNTDAIAKLNGDATQEGSVAKMINDQIKVVNSAAGELKETVDANKVAIEAINNETTGIKAVAAADAKSKADQALIDAKSYADGIVGTEATAREAVATDLATYKTSNDAAVKANADAIAAEKSRMDTFLAGAEMDTEESNKAIDTLKEIQAFIASDTTASAKMIQDIAANKTAIEKEATDRASAISTAVETEKNRATGVEGGLETRLAAVEGKFGEGSETVEGQIEAAKTAAIAAAKTETTTQVSSEKTRAEAKEAELKTAIETEVSDRATAITTAVEALDAEVSQVAGADGLALKVTQVDGKLTAVEGSIATNTYDVYGSATTAESNAKAYTDSLLTWGSF